MDVSENLKKVIDKIQQAEQRFQRSKGSVQLLAVSKKKSSEMIRQAYQAGQRLFAENYLQEALEKQGELRDCDIEWHFIGSIQANKTKPIAEHFDWVHSVDRFKIAKRLSDQRPSSMPPINICVEVNISDEHTKSGVSPKEVLSFLSEVSALESVRVRGLMVIPHVQREFELQKQVFDQVASLQKLMIEDGFQLDTLSMGMSQDFEAAIAAGSTMVRIGTAIFGARD